MYGLFYFFSLAIAKLLTNVDTFTIISYYIIVKSRGFPYTSGGDSLTRP